MEDSELCILVSDDGPESHKALDLLLEAGIKPLKRSSDAPEYRYERVPQVIVPQGTLVGLPSIRTWLKWRAAGAGVGSGTNGNR